MAKFTLVNTVRDTNVANNGIAIFFDLKTVKKSAGWTVPSSSDGTTYNTSGDQITVPGAGAGGLANTNAWFVIREPGGRREWCYQRTSAMLFRVKYSALSRFVIGSPSATRVPQAADEQIIAGSGTDASPVGGSFFNSAIFRSHIIANSNPIGGCYPFFFFMTVTPGITEGAGALWQEPIAPGSYDALDADPCIIGSATGGSGFTSSFISTQSKGWLAYGLGGATFLPIAGAVNATFNGTLPPDLTSGKDVNGRPLFTITSTGTRVKGYGSTIAIRGPARAWPTTANRAIDAYVYLGSLVIPYQDNTEPGV